MDTNKMRERFESAWRARYPEHGEIALKRSGLDPEDYSNTRVKDAWWAWQASREASAAEIDQLKAKNEALVDRLENVCRVAGIEQVTLLTGIEAMRKNSERYRWLRDSSESIHQFYLSTPIWFTGVKFSKENVDSTIDAALAKEASHG